MPTSNEAEEHLRIIRSLMEKATIYRAISAPTALIGGLTATGLGAWFYFQARQAPPDSEDAQLAMPFIVGWVAVLVVTTVANFWLIWRAACKRQEQFISPAMRKALWALFPPMLSGAFFTVLMGFVWAGQTTWALPPFWMVFYGLGLLATAQFSPRSIPILGWCFLLAGFVSFGVAYWLDVKGLMDRAEVQRATANLLMVATFGLFHLVYAACTWSRTGGDTES